MSNIEKFKFNPPQGFIDSNAYPDPMDEEGVREQLQRQHNQTRDYINRLTTLLEEKGASFIVTSDGKTIEEVLKEIRESQGVSDYKDLSNKPSINGVELNGDASLDDLGLTDAIERSTTEALTEAKESGMFNGSDGYTPVKGEDYFTEEDKDEIANEAIEKIPLASFENYGLVKVDSRTAASDNYVTVTHARDAGRNEAYFVPTIKRFNNKPSTLNANFLPVATADTIGVVKAGKNITIDENGSINVDIDMQDINLDDYAKKSEVPTKTSQLSNDSGFITVNDIPEAGEKNVITKVTGYGAGYCDYVGLTISSGQEYKTPVLDSNNLITSRRLPIATQSSNGAMSSDDKTKLDSFDLASNYAKKTDIPTDYAQKEHSHDEYLTSIPSEYITESELDSKGYLTEHQSLSAYSTTEQNDAKYQTKGNYLTSIPSEYVTDSELNAKGYLTEHQDLSAYSTTVQNDAKYQPKGSYLTSIPSEYVTESELNSKGYLTQHQDLSSYAKKSEVPTKTSQLTNDSGYLTSVPSEYVTETELTNKKYLTSIPSEYVTESELTSKGYATTTQVNQLSQEKVDLNQGVNNIGKILVVGADGKLTLTDMPSGGSEDAIGYVDENNNIILTGLNDGTYVIKYENVDGTYDIITTYVVGGVVQYSITVTLTECTAVSGNATIINEGETVTLKYVAKDGFALTDTVTVSGASYTWNATTGTLVLSNPTDDVTVSVVATKSGVTNIIDTVGYTDNSRINSSNQVVEQAGYVTTGMISGQAYVRPYTIYTKGVNFTKGTVPSIHIYKEDGTRISYTGINTAISNGVWNGYTITGDADGNLTIVVGANASYFCRLTGLGSGADLIVTINEEIPN